MHMAGGIAVGSRKGMALAGAIVGALAVALVAFGNPVNMGICVVCFKLRTGSVFIPKLFYHLYFGWYEKCKGI